MRWALWLLSGLAIAGLVHWGAIVYAPSLIMQQVFAGLSERAGWNTMHHPPRVDATSRDVVRPSPDLLYSICAYDLTQGPVRVTAGVPDSYWSLALYADNTDNYFVLNDRQTTGGRAAVTILPPGLPSGDEPAPGDGRGVRSPSTRGLVLIRTLITSEAAFSALDRIRQQADCTATAG